MPRLNQIIPMSGPMNDTIGDASLPSSDGFVRKRVNIRPDNIGDFFSNTGIAGTQLINMQLPAGINKTIGWCNDNENEAIIWFIFNSNQNHCIVRYFTLQGTTERIFYEEPTLGFTGNSVVNAEVIDGRLYWNDNTDQPKGFNINKAVNYTNSRPGESYSTSDVPFNENIFPYCKKPPRYKPLVEYASLTEFEEKSINFNNLRKKLWQVKYCYVYEDFQESPYSPISIVPLPSGETTSIGDWVTDITDNNALQITINTGIHNVKSIKVAIRDASRKNGGSFYVFTEIDKFDNDGVQLIGDNSTYILYFLNNTFMDSIDNDYGNAYFHDVPLSAKDLILLDGKYISMSMPKKGYNYDEIELLYSLLAVEEDVDFDTSYINMPLEYTEASPNLIAIVTIPETFYPNSVYQISYPCVTGDASASYSTPASEFTNWRTIIRNSLASTLLAFGSCGDRNIEVLVDAYRIRIYCRLDESSDFTVNAKITTTGISNSYKGLKRGQYHPFAIVYNDGFGRYNIAFGNKTLYSPLIDVTAGGPTSLRRIVKPQITITSRPPIDAITYRFAYIPYNSYTYVLFAPVVAQVIGEGVDVNGVPAGKSFLKINEAILRIIKDYPNSRLETYEWENGDRIRRWGYEESFEILGSYTREWSESGTDYTESGFLVEGSFEVIPPDTGKVDNLEIYRPNRSPQDKVFYEIGEEYSILDPGTSTRRHEGGSQNQSADLSLGAITLLDFGDVYYRERLTADAAMTSVFVEDNNYSDYYESTAINLGRGVIRTDSKQEILKRIVKSENYLENTELNRLNIFLAESEYFSVSEVYGDITRIREHGDVLKVIQAHKETSVYIGKNYAKDGQGNDIILVTDKVFGTPLPYKQYQGSIYPHAVALSDKYLYFFDHINGELYRSASNGTMGLASQYNMRKFFEETSKSFREYRGSKDIIISVESNTETIYVSFIKDENIETIVFSENEENKGFLFFVEFGNGNSIPEDFAWYGEDMYSFVGGKLYKHGVGGINQFHGSTRKTSSIEIVCNQYPQLQKSFETISLNTNGAWEAIFNIDADNNFTFGQTTKIYNTLFKSIEGKLTSAIPRNFTNRAGVTEESRLYSGNKMLGKVMKITLNSSNFDKIKEVELMFINQK